MQYIASTLFTLLEANRPRYCPPRKSHRKNLAVKPAQQLVMRSEVKGEAEGRRTFAQLGKPLWPACTARRPSKKLKTLLTYYHY